MGIKRFREDQGLTLKQLADIVDSSASYLSEVERGIKIPGSTLIKSLKDNFTELDLNKLFQIKNEDDPLLDDLTLD